MISLTDKFKSFCLKLDETRSETANKNSESANAPVKLYNIFKRSLPVGINTLVFQNVTEEDVNLLFRRVLRPKAKPDEPVVYWDAVAVGSAEAWNVYSNEGINSLAEEGSTGWNINTYREGPRKDVDWKD